MDANLYLRIEAAENEYSDAQDIAQVIAELSKHTATTVALIDAYTNAILNSEALWREIEQMPEFKAKYTSRRDASIYYYHVAQSVPNDD